MTAQPAKGKFNPNFPIVDASGNPTQLFRDYMGALDRLMTAMAAGIAPNGLVNAANDAAASAAGVPVQGIYRNGSILMVRVV